MLMVDMRSTVLSEAEKLIRTCGYAGFSYADIAATIGITKASIHHYFPTKEKLVATAIEVYRARYAEAFDQIEAGHSHALDRIDAYGRLYLAGLDQDLGCLCAALAIERDTLSEGLREATATFFKDHLDWLERTYVDGLSKGQVSDHLEAAHAAKLILSMLEGALLIERVLDKRDGFEASLGALRNTLSCVCSRR